MNNNYITCNLAQIKKKMWNQAPGLKIRNNDSRNTNERINIGRCIAIQRNVYSIEWAIYLWVSFHCSRLSNTTMWTEWINIYF